MSRTEIEYAQAQVQLGSKMVEVKLGLKLEARRALNI